MAKKRFISSILLCAFAILFAHSIVPHHHHEEVTATQQSSYYNDVHDDLDNNFLGHAFSHFQQEHGGTINYETASTGYNFSKVIFDKHTFLLFQYLIKVFYKPPIKYGELYPIHFTASYYYVTQLLRGPPSLLA